MTRAFRLAALAVAVVALGFVMGGLAVTGYASAWGDGRICWQGTTYKFDTEQAYYAFLGSHKGATEGACTPTTTTGVTTSLPPTSSTTTTPPSASTTVAASSTTAPSTGPPATTPSTPSVPPSTPNSDQPGEMCASSTNSDITPATSSGCAESSSTNSPPTSVAIQSDSSTPSQPGSASSQPLPKTGPDVTGWLIVATVTLAIGYGAVLLARKAK